MGGSGVIANLLKTEYNIVSLLPHRTTTRSHKANYDLNH